MEDGNETPLTIKQNDIKIATWKRLLLKTTKVLDCLVWNGDKSGSHYDGKLVKAHRISYLLHKNDMKPIPYKDKDGNRLVVRHMCKTKSCINPDHLELGTQIQNAFDDMIRDGTILRGDKHTNAKITSDLASKIKLSYVKKGETGYRTQKERAAQFGVTDTLVSSIDRGATWAHLPGPNRETVPYNRREKQRAARKKAKKRIWSQEDYETVMEKIKLNVFLTSENKKDHTIEGDCWEWVNYSFLEYGQVSFLGKYMGAHIASCEAKNGRHIKDDEVTRHLCGNRICCNPSHLEFGSRRQNALDSIKHRSNTRLREEDIVGIRNSSDSQKTLGKRYGVDPSTIYLVKRRKTWTHV